MRITHLILLIILALPVAQATSISIEPATSTATPGDQISITIEASDVNDLFSFSFDLYYDSTILQRDSIAPGNLLTQGGNGIDCYEGQSSPGHINDYGCTRRIGTTTGATGSGTLATINFTVTDYGTTALDLDDSLLLNTTFGNNRIPHNTQDGEVLVPAPNQAPTASFTYEPNDPITGQDITLTSTSTDEDGTITLYEWDTDNDGEYEQTGQSITITYTTTGTKTINHQVTDDQGAQATTSKSITVTNTLINTVTASVDEPQGTVPHTANFDCTATGGDGQLSYEWDFGDGIHAGGAQRTHTYTEAGTFIATCTVEDENGDTGSDSVTITITSVTNQPPTASFTYEPATPVVDDKVTFTSTSTDEDGQITAYAWDVDDDGSIEGNAETFTHTYTEAGDHIISLTITDDDEASAKIIETITVTNNNHAPLIEDVEDHDTPENTYYEREITVEDPDGDAVTCSKEEGPNWLSVSATTCTVSGHAPAVEEDTVVRITITASDPAGATNSTTYYLTITEENGNDPPTASFTIEPTSADIGETITLSSTSTDEDGQITLYEWDTDNDGEYEQTGQSITITYTTTGTKTINHQVTDDQGAQATTSKSITINGENQAPTIAPIDDQAYQAGTRISIPIEATDEDGDPITLELADDHGFLEIENSRIKGQTGETGTYDVTVKANDGQATTEESFTLTITETDFAIEITDEDVYGLTQKTVRIKAEANRELESCTLILDGDRHAGRVDGTTCTGKARRVKAGEYDYRVVATARDGTSGRSDEHEVRVTEPIDLFEHWDEGGTTTDRTTVRNAPAETTTPQLSLIHYTTTIDGANEEEEGIDTTLLLYASITILLSIILLLFSKL